MLGHEENREQTDKDKGYTDLKTQEREGLNGPV